VNRTLALTSPLMTGIDVGHAQTVLGGANTLKTRFYTGARDEAYGPLTAQAAFRAHYWLGFTLSDLNKLGHRYGDILDGLLVGRINLDAKRKALRTARQHAAGTQPLRERALANLSKHLGETENPPGSNISYATKWYGMTGPWCAMAVTEAYVEAGSKALVKGQRYAYVPYMEADARAGANNLTITLEPQAGDVVCFDWDNDGVSDHTGLFRGWVVHGQTFATVEGNTSADSNSNGGQVENRTRNLSDVSFRHTTTPAFIHVGA
jgi:hypothetical protein